MKHTSLLLLGICLASMVAEARPVRWYHPKELYEMADSVVLASVAHVNNTGTTDQVQLGTNPPEVIVLHKAELAVKYVLKGKIPDQVEFRYWPLAPSTGPVVNGASRVYLEDGATYIFYLKQAKEGQTDFYSGVLNGQYDDQQSVILVAPADAEQDEAAAVGASREETASDRMRIAISIGVSDPDGEIRVNGESVPFEGLREKLVALVPAGDRKRSVVLLTRPEKSPDRNQPETGRIADAVQQLLNELGFEKVAVLSR